jgi:3'-5' exoribonuclease
VPQFPEALLLHYLDDLDSKMEAMRALIENDRQLEGCFTTFNAALERSALKKERYLNPAPPPAPKPPTATPTAPQPPPPSRQPVLTGNSVMAEKLLQAGLLRPKAN